MHKTFFIFVQISRPTAALLPYAVPL